MSEFRGLRKEMRDEIKRIMQETKDDIKAANSTARIDRAISRLHRKKTEFDKEDLIDGILYAFEESDDRDDFARAVILELKAYGWDVKEKLNGWK